MYVDQLRRTGRTTRMIEEAVRLAVRGKAVFCVFASSSHAYQCFDLAMRTYSDLGPRGEATPGNHRIYFGALGGYIIFWSLAAVNVNWRTIHVVGAHSDTVTFIDHYVIEREWAAILEMLHRWDPNPYNTRGETQ